MMVIIWFTGVTMCFNMVAIPEHVTVSVYKGGES